MNDHIIIGQSGIKKYVVDSFILRDGTFLVVEPEQIRRAVYSPDLTYEQMDIVVTNGYNFCATVYWEPLTGAEYLLLLKDCGVLELLNSECERIDLLETGIEQDDEKKYFAFNERDNQVFINLSRNSIYAIQYQLKNRVMYFIKRYEEPRCIFEDTHKIIDMEISWNIDYESGRDFPTIAVLLKNEFSHERYFQVIRQAPTEARRKNQPWETFIGHSKLHLPIEDCATVLRAISNVGFFIFSARRVLFIKLPGGYEQTVKDKEFEQFEDFEGVFMEYESVVDDEVNLNAGIMLRRNINSLEFTAFTLKNYLLKICLRVIFEDPDDLVYHWDSLSLKKLQITGFTGAQYAITETFFLSNTLLALSCEFGNELLFLNLNQLDVVKKWPLTFSKIFFSDVIGTDFRKLVQCGEFANKQGYIESKFWGYPSFFMPLKSFTSENQVLELWNNNSGLWWKDIRGRIFRNGEFINTHTSPVHVSSTGSIIKDDSIISWSDILNDHNDNYVYVSKEGHIGWSDETDIVTFGELKTSSLVKYHLTCSKINASTKITVLSIDNKLTILNGTNTLKKGIDLTNELESITSICVICWHESLRLLITDIDGKLCELDVRDSKIYNKVRIGAQRAEICSVTDRNLFFIYTADDLLLMRMTDKSKFEIIKVDMEDRIRRIAVRDGSAIAILDNDYKIHQYKIPEIIPLPQIFTKHIDSDSYVHTKFISLSCSTRYVLTSSLRPEYSNLLQRIKYHSEIQLHDLEKQETVFRYDLSRNYPQALVSDMVPLPFNRDSFLENSMNPSGFYAMQLAFDRVFIVSMNYEMSEDESLHNLLLFSIDDNKGTIEFLQGINTGHPISALLNYHNRTLLIAGETLQAYKIDYLLKENTFKIESISNNIHCGGLIKTIARLPQQSLSSNLQQGKKRKLQTYQINEKLLLHNFLKGLQEYTLIQKTTCNSGHLQIIPIITSEKSSFWDNLNLNGLITHLSTCQIEETFWLMTGTTDRSISLYCVPNNDEPSLIQLKLPGDIIRIYSLAKCFGSFHTFNEDSLLQQNKKSILALFAISTSKGEYLIGTLKNNKILRKIKMETSRKMKEQFEFIQLENDQSSLNFIDSRVLVTSSLRESFEKAVF